MKLEFSIKEEENSLRNKREDSLKEASGEGIEKEDHAENMK